MLTILYKNASRSNYFIDCIITVKAFINYMSSKDAINIYRNDDCILPVGCDSTEAVVPCRINVKICNTDGVPCSNGVEGICPEFYIRTDRGIWNVFHKDSIYLITNNSSQKIQLCTREKSNIMKAAIVLEFINAETNEIVAYSDKLVVLSKPPIANKNYPFAKTRIANSNEESQNYSPLRCIKTNKNYVIVPEMQSQKTLPWAVISLGNYRNKKKIIEEKSNVTEKKNTDKIIFTAVKREREESEFEILQQQLVDMQEKIKKLEFEKSGLSKALKILAQDIQ